MIDKIIRFDAVSDERGTLVEMEQFKKIPFQIRRAYTILNTGPGKQRGFHAHKKEEAVAVCVAGSCRMVLDDGAEREAFLLNDPLLGLHIQSMVWVEMSDFSSDCVLLILSSTLFDADDYIGNYDEFIRQKKKGAGR